MLYSSAPASHWVGNGFSSALPVLTFLNICIGSSATQRVPRFGAFTIRR
jgi:hypothetical protein